jgi:hypothetical protein
MADPNAPTPWPKTLYAENPLVRSRSEVVRGSIACSIERNGPTSLPDVLIEPMSTPATSQMRLLVVAKIAPLAAMPAAPMTSTRRRPMRSAMPASSPVISPPPATAAVKRSPMAAGAKPNAARYTPRNTEMQPYAANRRLYVATSTHPSRVRFGHQRGGRTGWAGRSVTG